jgi:hypothetical protein
MDKMAMIGKVFEGIKLVIGGIIALGFIWILMVAMWILWG